MPFDPMATRASGLTALPQADFGSITRGMADTRTVSYDSLHKKVRRALPGALLAFLLLALAACETDRRPRERTPDEVRALLQHRLLPNEVYDRAGWATDIQVAFSTLGIRPNDENLCAAIAITQQESTFVADPEVPGLARIARAEIDRRAKEMNVPRFVVNAALKLESPDGRTYGERIATVRTEGQLSALFEEMASSVPVGKKLLGRANPVRTGGPMQVSIAFAEEHARRRPYPYADAVSIRREVFTRRGGMYFGIAHLLAYRTSYTRKVHRFADFNAGTYASRNAAFQQAVSRLTGVKLALDGDLVVRERRRGRKVVGATEAAVRTLGPQLGLSDAQIRRALEESHRFDFEGTALYTRLYAMADAQAGVRVPRAVMPRIELKSPKFTRQLTTEWFATRVDHRYRQCMARAR
jgi:hypothetical protein